MFSSIRFGLSWPKSGLNTPSSSSTPKIPVYSYYNNLNKDTFFAGRTKEEKRVAHNATERKSREKKSRERKALEEELQKLSPGINLNSLKPIIKVPAKIVNAPKRQQKVRRNLIEKNYRLRLKGYLENLKKKIDELKAAKEIEKQNFSDPETEEKAISNLTSEESGAKESDLFNLVRRHGPAQVKQEAFKALMLFAQGISPLEVKSINKSKIPLPLLRNWRKTLDENKVTLAKFWEEHIKPEFERAAQSYNNE